MPRGKYIRKPRVTAIESATEIAAAVAALDLAKAESAAALDAAASAGPNKFLQEQSKQLLERVEADVTARADEPSGIEVGVDYNFFKQDPTDFAPRLERKGLGVRTDHRYHWINRDPRRMERRLGVGWLPVEGGAITNGDSVLASMPEDKAKGLDRQLEARRAIRKTAHIDRLVAEGRRNNMEVFSGDKSLRDGLDK